jgi:dipeptidyl aminopeptidase/acylaminoacyl peptidase
MHSDTIRLSEFDAATGAEKRVIAQDAKGSMLVSSMERYVALKDPRSKQVLAVPFQFDIPTWSIVDPSVTASFAFLQRFRGGALAIDSQDLSSHYWTVTYHTDRAPPAAYLFDAVSREMRALGDGGNSYSSYRLSDMRAIEVPARDGMMLLVYVTLPVVGSDKHLPTVMLIHGGPWYRDDWGFSPIVQLLANRGYAVIQVQYRGSDGLGMRYLNAGTRQMGTGTDDDIADVVQWAIRRGITDPNRVAAMGYSFGGYHVLRAVTRHPDLYAAGVVIAGNSDLATSLQVIPPYWQPVLKRHLLRLGNVLADADLNRRLSPLQNVSSLRSPLLIAVGLNDARNNVLESQQIVDAARQHGVHVDFVVYPDEGHFITRAPNEQDLYGRIEEFLYTHLGGRREAFAQVAESTAETR